jgi:hypothetical protein
MIDYREGLKIKSVGEDRVDRVYRPSNAANIKDNGYRYGSGTICQEVC